MVNQSGPAGPAFGVADAAGEPHTPLIPMSTVTVRRATPEDAPTAMATVRASITRLCVDDHQNDAATLERWLSNKTVDFFLLWLSDPSSYLVVAELGPALCGVGSSRKGGLLTMIYVAPGQQGCGVGRALLSELEAQFARWGERELSLTSTAGARAFYERQGFIAAGRPQSKFGVLSAYPYRKTLGS